MFLPIILEVLKTCFNWIKKIVVAIAKLTTTGPLYDNIIFLVKSLKLEISNYSERQLLAVSERKRNQLNVLRAFRSSNAQAQLLIPNVAYC